MKKKRLLLRGKSPPGGRKKKNVGTEETCSIESEGSLLGSAGTKAISKAKKGSGRETKVTWEMKTQNQRVSPTRAAAAVDCVPAGAWKAFEVGGNGENRPSVKTAGSLSLEETQMIAMGHDFAALVAALTDHTRAIGNLVATLAPEIPDMVGTDYIARRLGCSKQWVGAMAERGDIPKHCIAPKVSGGRIWKFHRDKIDAWLREREEA